MKNWLIILGVALWVVNARAADGPAFQNGLVVHEWGVFSVNTDADFANAQLRAEWDDLPECVYGYIKGRTVPQHWGAVERRLRPLIFFHAAEPARVHVKIDFPGGQAGAWYPATVNPAVEKYQKQPKIGNVLEWDLAVKACPDGWLPKNQEKPKPAESQWLTQNRAVEADVIYSHFGPRPTDVERDKFLYYDGIFPQGKWLKITADKQNVAISSQVQHPVFDITIVDRRDDTVRIGRVAELAAGGKISKVEFTSINPAQLPREGAELLRKQLIAAGLNHDESGCLVEIWKKDLFERPGLTAFYRLPQSEYDRRMPLTITPKPESQVRVGLIYHAHLEPDFPQTILELVKQLESPRFQDRDAADKKIHEIGPAVLVQLQRIRAREKLAPDLRVRLDALIKRWNVKDAFDTDEQTP